MGYTTVQCPRCGNIIELRKLDKLSFKCGDCKTMLEVEFNKDERASIK